jgi:hypothetical protein
MTTSLKAALSEDRDYARFLQIRDTAFASINVDAVLKEAEFLHSSRKSRSLTSAKLSPLKVQEAICVEMSARSRLVELRAAVMKSNELLTTALSAIRRHIRVSYSDELKELAKTQNERTTVLDKLMGKSVKFKDQLDHVEDVLDMYIKDIDQNAFGLRNLVEILKLFLDRRSTEI